MARISMSELARIRGCTKQAISDAVKRGRVILEDDGTVDLTRDRNAEYLQHRGRPGPKPAGARPAPKPRTRKPTAIPQDDALSGADPDDLTAADFAPPPADAPQYLGRLASQRARLISALRLLHHRVYALRDLYFPQDILAEDRNAMLDKFKALEGAADLVDWKTDDPAAAIDNAIDIIYLPMRQHPEKESAAPPGIVKADGFDDLDLERLRSAWDELHGLRHRIILAAEVGEILLITDIEKNVADVANDVRMLILGLGRRLGPRLGAIAETQGPEAASAALKAEIQDALGRLERHRLTPIT